MDVLTRYKNGERLCPEDLSTLDEQDLLDLKTFVDEDILQISSQLLRAKQELAINGNYGDPNWFRRATFAKKSKGQLSQRIQNEISRQRRERTGKFSANWQDAMIKALLEAMDELLLPAEKQEILSRARVLRRKYFPDDQESSTNAKAQG